MSEAYPGLLGRIAVHNKLISNEQLREATLEQSRHPNKRLGEIMVEKGFISDKQLEKLLSAQQRALQIQRQRQMPRRQSATPLTREVDLQQLAEPPIDESSLPPPPVDSLPAPPVRAVSSAPKPSLPPRSLDEDWRAWLDHTLGCAAELGASDVLVQGGATVRYRRLGVLEELADEPLSRSIAEALLRSIVPAESLAQLEARGDIDFVHVVPRVGRFRANVQRSLEGHSAAFHFLPLAPASLALLRLPSTLARLTQFADGLVVVTGPARSGKTSTLAALVDLVNEERSEHILTIEDPIELFHPSKACLVSQRQVGRDSSSFAAALRAALHEDPDVICIGELRDVETMALALSAAESGHLVLATMHARGALRAIELLVSAFPQDQHAHVSASLSETLRAVAAQRLVRALDGSVQPVVELCTVNKAVARLIHDGRGDDLAAALRACEHGMVSFDAALAELVRTGIISPVAR